ncbi:EAL domain-containing protein [Xylella taiwanensis]|uniref:EAL domain-containing protein n=1 Tax=Xylella taiwanensis TaxID=1444770 RepID=Z9JIS3_9GAMM|nr:EAL domain-containing protein [Xylella taiwanensis]AXI84306.1 membrane protein [Xylella taiwanensis]EWS77736.1 membrane protein [Xylella taiwanensis]MCD8457423.1 EAL domain-containing protein [Xylella taiwanensis]MCD8457581.1 EAL domain-containing protein [Xylella taiwanensis]MCD8461295.1 EAL domain-containing protein [Xylella taiwanensis]
MKKNKEHTLRLMIIDDNAENAESIVTLLRNSGIAVRPSRPQHLEDVTMMLRHQIDLVLASNSCQIPLRALHQQIFASGKDVPLIQLTWQLNEKEWIAATNFGIRAIALNHHPKHLLEVVNKEIEALQVRRNLRRVEAQMRETERRCNALIASSRDPIAYVHEGMHIHANQAYLRIFGFESFEDIEGLPLLDLIAAPHIEGFKHLLKTLSKGESPPSPYKLDARHLKGNIFPTTMEFTATTYESEPCIQVVLRNCEEFNQELAREIEKLRQRDPVTGLLNRPAFIIALEDALTRASMSKGQFGLLLVEPNHYTEILQEIGLDSADTLITALADFFSEMIDPKVEVRTARFCETKFALLLEGDYTHTMKLAERIRIDIAQHIFLIGKHSTTVTVSIGGVQIDERIASLCQVLYHAVESVQVATQLGGNTVIIYDPAAADRAEEQRIQNLLKQLQQALANNDFIFHYQQIISLQQQSLELYQIYLRMHGNEELISSAALLEIAKKSELIAQIDRWVVARAIAQIGERQRAGHTTHLLVQIDSASFSDPDLLTMVRAELAAHNVPGEQLWLQTPESKVFTHLHNAQQFLSEISVQGCKMGLEQFGTGLDSFQLLAHFKPAFLKLDRHLTQDINSNNNSLEKIREITARAQDTGIATFAEFVTDSTSMSALFNVGVDYVQGDFIAPISSTMNHEF